MTSRERKTAIIVGALFLIALVVSIMGGTIIDSVLDAPDYISDIAANETKLVAGVLMELMNGVAVIGIAVLLFPILKKQDEALALGYVALRLIEAVIIIAAVIGPMTLIALSQEMANPAAADPSVIQSVGASFVAVRAHLVGQLTGIFFSLAALLLYALLYQSRIVPRFIPVWGIIGVALVFSWNILEMFGVSVGVGVIFGLPIILNEAFLAIWLIAKGFNPSAVVFEPTKSAISRA
jgi:hypothetical protein